MTWEDGELTMVRVTSLKGEPLALQSGDHRKEMPTKDGTTYSFDGRLNPQ